MELTSRGNIQIRGIRGDEATDALADAVAAAGLLPSATHERVRNIVASPLSGRVGGHTDVRDWVHRLDAAIRTEPALAALPGRFWFGIDDGRGDVAGLGADVGVLVSGDSVAVLLACRDTGVRIAPSDVVPTLISVAKRFVDTRENCWRVAELTDPLALVDGLPRTVGPGASRPPVTRPPVGWINQDDGRIALGAAVPLGVLQARVAEYLAAINAPMIVTPWRSVLVCDLDDGVADASLRVLAPMGLVFDETHRGSASAPAPVALAANTPPPMSAPTRRVRWTTRAASTATSSAANGPAAAPPGGEVLVADGDGYRLRSASP